MVVNPLTKIGLTSQDSHSMGTFAALKIFFTDLEISGPIPSPSMNETVYLPVEGLGLPVYLPIEGCFTVAKNLLEVFLKKVFLNIIKKYYNCCSFPICILLSTKVIQVQKKCIQ
uniref:Putative increased recombination centers protein 14 n=1 Tax=Saccharomyces cerevisiae (strain ATCC 204508 / S288c) TaxID=559292 RepID=IRC14_YEAST|nr:RecName: Full=Putative increased recombination centers protein 14 [Saccharomyces cerevisiae S288C]CAA99334.1 unnamed protein product [Saccharomyces cerevisiae]